MSKSIVDKIYYNLFFSTTKRLTVVAAKILLIKTVRIDFFYMSETDCKFYLSYSYIKNILE